MHFSEIHLQRGVGGARPHSEIVRDITGLRRKPFECGVETLAGKRDGDVMPIGMDVSTDPVCRPHIDSLGIPC